MTQFVKNNISFDSQAQLPEHVCAVSPAPKGGLDSRQGLHAQGQLLLKNTESLVRQKVK